MADRKNPSPEGRNSSSSPGPFRRQRAPTITIDTSAVNNPEMGNAVPLGNLSDSIHTVQTQRSETSFSTQSQTRSSPVDLRNANSFDSNQDRPTSPHNVSSPSQRWGNDPKSFLSVPNSRSRVVEALQS
ncbi:ATPAse P-type K/Mg/Cd/Cu/Zn/Na/Ca/Na/H-transporter [Neofusicoccum parvum]|nr:ATPAse P-type K/Mg/Cd/Cu/Zn/Na/Ca/Na/H-transporter [Neofusicoccum parvum]